MSSNTHEPNASPAYGYSLRVITCCTCSKTTIHSAGGNCSNCDHLFCRMCPGISSVSAPQALRLTSEAPRTLPTPQQMPILKLTPPPPPLVVASESNQPQNLNGHGEQHQPEKARNEVNKDEEHEIRPHGRNPEEQQSLPTPGQRKRKLNMVKCDRCRTDKKRVSD